MIVVEDKQPFLESQIKELLYGVASAPEVFGKYDRQGATLFTSYASLDADHISAGLARVLPVASLGATVDISGNRRRSILESRCGKTCLRRGPLSSAQAAHTTSPRRRRRTSSWALASAATRSCR